MKIKSLVALAALCASSIGAFAGNYTDVTANNSFAAAVNLNPYFSNGYSPDVGDVTGANTSLSAPWVTVQGNGNNAFDYFRVTTSAVGNFTVDLDYTAYHSANPNGFDPLVRIYNSSFAEIAMNDDGGTVAGAGGSVHGYDSFVQLDNLAAGTYYVALNRYYSYDIDSSRDYTMQVQAQVSAVPEPETYAMMLAGLGVMGAVARRRKVKQA
jgi:hypothetical protein